MGGDCFTSGTYRTDNESENFIRDVILTLKIRHMTYSELFAHFEKAIKFEQREQNHIIQKFFIFDEEDYDVFINSNFIDEKNIHREIYKEFHRVIAPTYSEIADSNKFEFSFLSATISYVKDDNKDLLVGQILSFFDENQINFRSFQIFIRFYLEQNLLLITSKVYHYVLSIRKSFMVDQVVIDSEFKEKLKILVEKVFNLEKVQILEKKIIHIMLKIINPDNTEHVSHVNEIPIMHTHLTQLIEAIPWLFDCLELRNYFYANRNDFK